MPVERLSFVLEAFVASLAEANASLAERPDDHGGITYRITGLDASLAYGALELREGVVLVDLRGETDMSPHNVIKIAVSPVVSESRESEPHPVRPDDVVGRRLRNGLAALATAGFEFSQVLVAFDPTSERPDDTIISYDVERDTFGHQRLILMVAGGPPDDVEDA